MPDADTQEFITRFWNGNTYEAVLVQIGEWIDWDVKPVATDVLRILENAADAFRAWVNEQLCQCWDCYEDRFVVEVDASHNVKTPDRILAKMVRQWVASGCTDPPPLGPHNYQTTLTDALRFRFVVNFIEDGDLLYEQLLKELQDPESGLGSAFRRAEPNPDACSVHLPLDQRTSGERSWKLRLVHNELDVRVELQICTQLQVAWDKKDHFLIYERARKGLSIAPGDRILMKHVSDQLYVVDRQLDDLKCSIIDRLAAGKEQSDA